MNMLQPLASHEARLNRVIDYVYDRLEEDIGVDRLAEIACLSPFHWHRVYTAMRGETLAATVERLRPHRAADRLANSGRIFRISSASRKTARFAHCRRSASGKAACDVFCDGFDLSSTEALKPRRGPKARHCAADEANVTKAQVWPP